MENIYLFDKSYNFFSRIIKLSRYINEDSNKRTLSKQLLFSAASIGAYVDEAVNAHSKADFFANMNLAYKGANKTEYLLNLFHNGGFIDNECYESIYDDCIEIVKFLSVITKHHKEG